MKITHRLFTIFGYLIIFGTSWINSTVAYTPGPYANLDSDPYHSSNHSNYYENEGELIFKIRGVYNTQKAVIKNLPPPTNYVTLPSSFVVLGYGMDSAVTYFVTTNIAVELSAGMLYYRAKSGLMYDIFNAYGTGNSPVFYTSRAIQIYMIPLTATVQYYLAPFGPISPYVGAGYHAAYTYNRYKGMQANHGAGPVIQAGIDFIGSDDTIFTFDIRKYFLTAGITFQGNALGLNQDINGKIRWDPMIISAGFSFKF